MSVDQRRLHRIQNRYSSEIVARCKHDHKVEEFRILDFNTLGVRLSLKDETPISEIEDVEIYYGSFALCKFEHPKILRQDISERILILSLTEKNKVESQKNRKDRIAVSQINYGLLCGTDPMTVDHQLYFRVTDLSDSGFRLISSRSNGHLLPGMKFTKFNLQMPGFSATEVDFEISNVKESNDALSFGCRLTVPNKKYSLLFKKFSIVHGDLKPRSSRTIDHLRSDIRTVGRFRGHIRVHVLRTDDEYKQVLRIRHKAYVAAKKTQPGQTEEDMGDEYDKHSLILVAYVGRNMVGTLRIVIRDPGTSLPCEKLFNFRDLPQIVPEQSAEISRYAIDPLFQGSDIFLSIYQKLTIELGAKRIQYPICMATPELAASYIGVGAIAITGSVPHPTVPDETLTLYWLTRKNVYQANTNSLSWVFVIRPAFKILNRFGLEQELKLGWTHFLKFPFQLATLIVSKKLRRLRKYFGSQRREQDFDQPSEPSRGSSPERAEHPPVSEDSQHCDPVRKAR